VRRLVLVLNSYPASAQVAWEPNLSSVRLFPHLTYDKGEGRKEPRGVRVGRKWQGVLFLNRKVLYA